MKKVQPKGPYKLMGHSFGGLVAYEMARVLLQNDEEVESLSNNEKELISYYKNEICTR